MIMCVDLNTVIQRKDVNKFDVESFDFFISIYLE